MTLEFVQSEFVGHQSAPETTRGVQATTGWRRDEANGITNFYPEMKHVRRKPISPNMMAEKGAVVGLSAKPSIASDLTRDLFERYAQAWFCSVFKFPGGTGTGRWAKGDSTLTAVTSTGFTVAAGGAVPNGVLVYSTGWATAGNNGLKVTAGSVTGEVKCAGLTAETPAPAGAILYVVGFQGTSGDIVINAGLNIASTTLDFTTLGLQAGAFAWLGGGTAASPGALGFATAADRGFFQIVSVAANLITVARRTQAWTADTGTSKTIQVFVGPWVRNVPGTDTTNYREPSFSLEVSYPGAGSADATAFAYGLGSCVDQVEINAASEDKVTAAMSFVGMNITALTETRATGADAPVAPLGNGAFTTADQVRRIRIATTSGETSVVTSIFDWKLTLKKNVKPLVKQGVLGAADMVFGEFEVMGDVTAYFADVAACNAIRGNTTCAFDVALQSTDCCIVWDVPSFDPMGGSPDIKPNEAVTLPVQAGAFRDTTFSYVAAATMFPYLPSS